MSADGVLQVGYDCQYLAIDDRVLVPAPKAGMVMTAGAPMRKVHAGEHGVTGFLDRQAEKLSDWAVAPAALREVGSSDRSGFSGIRVSICDGVEQA